MSDVTQLLVQIEAGNSAASESLLPLVYDELRRLAALKLAREKPGHTLQATGLVHEAYLRLLGNQNVGDVGTADDRWNSRRHFFAAAAEAMRRVLVDLARRKASQKLGGQWQRQEFDEGLVATLPPCEEVLAVHEALEGLSQEDSLAAELVKLHYFGGFSFEDAAEYLGLSRATAYRIWVYARAWLRAALQDRAPT